MKVFPLALAFVAALTAIPSYAQNATALNAALANPSRPAADREADARRKCLGRRAPRGGVVSRRGRHAEPRAALP